MLSKIEIDSIAKTLDIKIDGVFMKNELIFERQNRNYIINLDDSGNDGTHWTALIVENNQFYFDSYGCPPPEQIISFCKKAKKHTFIIIQE